MSGTSAAPRPEPDPGQDLAEAEGWALLDGLRRRLDEQGTQTRKTAAQVQQLADSIGALVAAQRRAVALAQPHLVRRLRRFSPSYWAARSYFLYLSRAHDLVAARDRAVGERDAATCMA